MNIKAQLILNKYLNNVEVADANRHIINAMKEFASNYHKEQLTLTDVVTSLPSKDEKLIRNMSISYRHDFSLLSEQERNKLMNDCKNWLISYENNRK